MANEISVNVIINARNGQMVAKGDTGPVNCSQTNPRKFSNTQVIGTSWEELVFGDLAVPRLVKLRNQDATNFIQIGLDIAGTATASQRLKPLDPEIVMLLEPGATIKAKADTAACNLDVFALDA